MIKTVIIVGSIPRYIINKLRLKKQREWRAFLKLRKRILIQDWANHNAESLDCKLEEIYQSRLLRKESKRKYAEKDLLIDKIAILGSKSVYLSHIPDFYCLVCDSELYLRIRTYKDGCGAYIFSEGRALGFKLERFSYMIGIAIIQTSVLDEELKNISECADKIRIASFENNELIT